MRIRQLALVARDLDPVVEDLCAVFGIEVCYNDPEIIGFGLENALMTVGEDCFLEVVSPVQENTTAGRLLDKRGGDGGYMVIVQVDDLGAKRAHVEGVGARIVWEVAFDDAAAIHLHPKDVGGAILSFDWMKPPESWRWAGPEWKDYVRTEITTGFAGVAIQSADSEAASDRWSEILQLPAQEVAAGVYQIPIDGESIALLPDTDGRGDSVVGIGMRVVDKEKVLATARGRGLETDAGTVTIAGTRFTLHETQ